MPRFFFLSPPCRFIYIVCYSPLFPLLFILLICSKNKKLAKAKINNMLVSGNMTPKKMGRQVGKQFYFKKKFCPIFYLMTHLFPTAQLKNRGVEDQKKKKKMFSLIQVVYICKVNCWNTGQTSLKKKSLSTFLDIVLQYLMALPRVRRHCEFYVFCFVILKSALLARNYQIFNMLFVPKTINIFNFYLVIFLISYLGSAIGQALISGKIL